MRITNVALTGLIIFSGINVAHAQQVRGMHKHDASIAQHSYSVPIETGESATAGGSLKSDIDQGAVALEGASYAATPSAAAPSAQGTIMAPSVDTSQYMNRAIPNFSLPSVQGGTVSLANLTAQGKAIIVFIRGTSVNHSLQQLQLLQKNLPQFAALGIQVAAITPEPVASARAAQQRHNFGFPVLTDQGSALATQFGIVQSGQTIPAMFSIDQQGKIVAAQIIPAQYGVFNLTEAAAPFRGGVTQPAVKAPPSASVQQPSGDAMIRQVPGNAPVAQGNSASSPQMLGHMGESDPVMPSVPSPRGANMPSPVMPQPMSFEVPPSSSDFLKNSNTTNAI